MAIPHYARVAGGVSSVGKLPHRQLVIVRRRAVLGDWNWDVGRVQGANWVGEEMSERIFGNDLSGG